MGNLLSISFLVRIYGVSDCMLSRAVCTILGRLIIVIESKSRIWKDLICDLSLSSFTFNFPVSNTTLQNLRCYLVT